MREEREAVYRCYDDQCRQRAACRWWAERDVIGGRVAMTWRTGHEDHSEHCQRWSKLKPDPHCEC